MLNAHPCVCRAWRPMSEGMCALAVEESVLFPHYLPCAMFRLCTKGYVVYVFWGTFLVGFKCACFGPRTLLEGRSGANPLPINRLGLGP